MNQIAQAAQVPVTDGVIEVLTAGEVGAALVVFLPSLGRGATDFADLGARVAAAGYRVAAPQPRGIGGSDAPLDGLTQSILAADVAAVIDALSPDGTAVVVGHAFGNRIARTLATDHPERVRSLVLLACGGQVDPEPEHRTALTAVFDESLSAHDHLQAVGTAFFAPGHDARVWADGWFPHVARAQRQAQAATEGRWREAGTARVLIVQPANDVIAPPANAVALAELLGDRASITTVPDAGHALLPEQPARVAELVLDHLRRDELVSTRSVR